MVRFENSRGEAVYITPEDVRGISPGFNDGTSWVVFNASTHHGVAVRGTPDEVAEKLSMRTPTEGSSSS